MPCSRPSVKEGPGNAPDDAFVPAELLPWIRSEFVEASMARLIPLLLLAAVVLRPVGASAQSDRCAFDTPYPRGAVFALEGTPHVWLFDYAENLNGSGFIRWAGDTRALSTTTVRWERTCLMDVAFLNRMTKGDPLLS